MIDLLQTKTEILETLHSELRDPITKISLSEEVRGNKAKAVNRLVSEIRSRLAKNVSKLENDDKPNYALVLQYCCSVVSLEYRHVVWPYEYMAFSRRVGELWEGFCSAAWDFPSRPNVKAMAIPSFGAVRKAIADRIEENIGTHGKKAELLEDTNLLFEIIGDINMKEDKVFRVDEIPHVIDFKSGFGSNEKGNMLRLQTVGRAYRIWDHQTRLMLLVRQEENNNYLKVLRRAGLWEVHTGVAAYKQISQLTGADMQTIRDTIFDWPRDLSPDLVSFLKNANLMAYLNW